MHLVYTRFYSVPSRMNIILNTAEAHMLARIAEEEDWAGEVYVHRNQEKIDRCWEPGEMNTGS